LLAIAVIVAILTIVLAVLQALLKVRFVSDFSVVAVSVLVAILIWSCGAETAAARLGVLSPVKRFQEPTPILIFLDSIHVISGPEISGMLDSRHGFLLGDDYCPL